MYRNDVNPGDKRSVDEICQQELKNAIRTMGYARSSSALAAAAERGLKYGRKTGEIVQDDKKQFLLGK